MEKHDLFHKFIYDTHLDKQKMTCSMGPFFVPIDIAKYILDIENCVLLIMLELKHVSKSSYVWNTVDLHH